MEIERERKRDRDREREIEKERERKRERERETRVYNDAHLRQQVQIEGRGFMLLMLRNSVAFFSLLLLLFFFCFDFSKCCSSAFIGIPADVTILRVGLCRSSAVVVFVSYFVVFVALQFDLSFFLFFFFLSFLGLL